MTYRGDSLHAQHESVLCQVSRVAQAVLLPQLAKQILLAAHPLEVVRKVSLEEQVDASTQHKPQNGCKVAVAEIGSNSLHNHKGDAEDGSAACCKHADKLKSVPFVGQVADDLRLDGVVGVRLARGKRKVTCCHGCELREERERVEEVKSGLWRFECLKKGKVTTMGRQLFVGNYGDTLGTFRDSKKIWTGAPR